MPQSTILIKPGEPNTTVDIVAGTLDPSTTRLAVSSETLIAGGNLGKGSVPGKDMRYELTKTKIDLNANAGAFKDVYTISENSIFYKYIFQVNSDNIMFQVEIDSQVIFPAGGILLEDLEDLCLGGTGGYAEEYGGGGRGDEFGLYQYDSNKWMWVPPDCLLVASSLKVQMKSSDSYTSRDFLKGLAVRRTLV